MGRLKGLDEMPDRTGLELDWSSILPHVDGMDEGHGTVRTSSIVSLGLAVLIVAGGVHLIGKGMIPTGDQIRAEMQRHVASLTNARNSSDTLAPAVRPGIDGVRTADGSQPVQPYSPLRGDFYKETLGTTFPQGRIDVDDMVRAAPMLVNVDVMDFTGNGLNKVVRIRGLSGDAVWTTAYLQAGGQVTLSLPPGGYRVFIAEGAAWFDEVEQFRDEGVYYEPQNLDVRAQTRVRIELPPSAQGASLGTTSRKTF